jgi:UDP-N-acetyl-D-mannosaminuronic acid dehydrogenase
MAEAGFDVLGLEKDKEKLAGLLDGDSHVEEPQLQNILRTQRRLGNLAFAQTTDEPRACECEAYVIAVGSPLGDDGSPRTDIVTGAVRSAARVVDEDDLVVLRSTTPPGTGDRMAEVIEEESGLKVGDDVLLAHAPERTAQGAAMEELRRLPQVVGGYNERSAEAAEDLFREFKHTIVRVESLRGAEMVKLLDNTYRDVNIALGNAFGEIARAHGLDGQRLVDAANKGYHRNDIKKPGAGVGGGCLPKDPYLLLEGLPSDDADLADLISEFILYTTAERGDAQRDRLDARRGAVSTPRRRAAEPRAGRGLQGSTGHQRHPPHPGRTDRPGPRGPRRGPRVRPERRRWEDRVPGG